MPFAWFSWFDTKASSLSFGYHCLYKILHERQPPRCSKLDWIDLKYGRFEFELMSAQFTFWHSEWNCIHNLFQCCIRNSLFDGSFGLLQQFILPLDFSNLWIVKRHNMDGVCTLALLNFEELVIFQWLWSVWPYVKYEQCCLLVNLGGQRLA